MPFCTISNIPGDGFTMMAGIPIGALTPGQALFSWKDFRIYPRLITNSEITALATDETVSMVVVVIW